MVKIDYIEMDNVLSKLQEGKFSTSEYFKLNFLANTLMLRGKREDLIILDELKDKITIYPHQINAALTYLNEMDGRILLADEVGLGKTIEAGIIMKELMARDEISKILVLCPTSLTAQWQTEMAEKFLINFEINSSVHHWSNYDKIIASIDTAKKPKHINEIKSIKWDVIVIDEAHKLKNRNTQGHKAIKDLWAENKVFLTATPIQNTLLDLYNIIELLDEGFLAASPHDFMKKFFLDNKGLKVGNTHHLSDLLERIMVRSTRKETGLEFTKRNVSTILINETKEEDEFSSLALNFIQNKYLSYKEQETNLKGVGTLQLMSLARMLASCRYAFSLSFKKYLKNNANAVEMKQGNEILKMNEKLPENMKFQKTVELVKKINDKVIIFTQFLATQGEIAEKLRNNGHKVSLIRGGMSTEEKKFSIRSLKNSKVDVLICTEAGSEGLNMQFCHNLINYDLPWNPMKIEQRIGRIHRIGQEYDVNIYNLAVKGTIEEYILSRLYEKIDLFHTAIGEMADILTRIMDEESFEKTLFEILMKNREKIDIQKKMDELMEKMKHSKEFQENVNKLDNATLGLFNLSPLKK